MMVIYWTGAVTRTGGSNGEGEMRGCKEWNIVRENKGHLRGYVET